MINLFAKRIETMFHGTSDRFLRQILKEGLVQKKERVWDESKGRLASLEGIYLTENLPTALSSATNAISKFGGKRLIVVCRISVYHHPVDEDIVSSVFLPSHIDSHITLRNIERGLYSLKNHIDRKCNLLADIYFSDPGVAEFLKKNRKLIASLIIKFLAYNTAKYFEDAMKKGVLYYGPYPRTVFVYSGRDPVLVKSYPVLKKSSDEWYKLYRSDLDKLTRLLGRYVQKFLKGKDFSLRVNKVGYRGANRIVAIFRENKEHSYDFDPVYIAKGFDSHIREFVNHMVKFRYGDHEEIQKEEKVSYKKKMEKKIKDKTGISITL